MPFVKTNFRLPTVTRADGTLGSYVQYNSNPQGDSYIWPAQRIAIYQAQQAAKLQAAKKKKMFSLFDIFAGSPSPATAPAHANARPGKRGVQTSAKGKTLGASGDNMPYGPPAPDDLIMQSGGVDPETMQFYSQPGNTPSNGVAAVMATQVINDAVNKVLSSRSNSSTSTPQPPQQTSLVGGIPNTALYIGGGLAAAGVLIAIAKGGRR